MAIHDPVNYWCTGVLAYFDAMGQSATPEGAAHPITTRERLESYDPDLFEFIKKTMAYEGRVDWRFEAAKPGDRR